MQHGHFSHTEDLFAVYISRSEAVAMNTIIHQYLIFVAGLSQLSEEQYYVAHHLKVYRRRMIQANVEPLPAPISSLLEPV